MWANTSSGADQVFLSKGVSDPNEEYSIIRLGYWDYGGNAYVQTSAFSNDGNWRFVGVVYNASSSPRGSIYYNGAAQSISTSGSGSHIVSSGSNLYIGTQGNGTPYYGGRVSWSGLLDDVRIYSRALTASEISAIYNATK